MNTSEIRYNPVESSVFPGGAGQKTKLVSSQTPLADLMLHPEKVDAVLKATTSKKSAPATRKPKAGARMAAKTASGSGVSDRQGSPGKKTKFTFKATRAAGSVKLAGDFTDWEKFPIDMKSSENGEWLAVISLEPGRYAYRYIVDGQWHDDPHCTRQVANPFGTQNAVVEIT